MIMTFAVMRNGRSVTEMNHDYAHCLDFRDDCPKQCFRAQLVRDFEVNEDLAEVWLSWMHFGGTAECKRKGGDGNE